MNIRFLELEESLVECGILTVEEIQRDGLPEARFDALIDKVLMFQQNSQPLHVLFATPKAPEILQEELHTQLNLVDLSKSLHELSLYLNYTNTQLTQEEWIQKYQSHAKGNLDRCFSTQFLNGQEKFKEYFLSINETITKSGVPNSSTINLLSLAFARMGLFKESAFLSS